VPTISNKSDKSKYRLWKEALREIARFAAAAAFEHSNTVACPQKALGGVIVNATLKLAEEYRSTRAALVNAGVNMTDSIDALYRDWRRWRDRPPSLGAVGA
jgi:hypothetical protein